MMQSIKFKPYLNLCLTGIGLIMVVFLSAKYFGSTKYKPAIKQGSRIEYVSFVEYRDKPIFVTKIKAQIDTVYQIDSIYLDKPVIVASADTLLVKDSSSVKVKYYFPPLNYFDIGLNTKEKTIIQKTTITEPYNPSFWDRFNLVLYGGAGYDIVEHQPTISIGIGLGFNLKKIF